MTKRVLDHDPLTGITTYFEYTPDDQMLITHAQDVTRILDEVEALRNNEQYSRDGIKNDMWHYCRLPLNVILDMKQRFGLDMMAAKPDWKSFFRLVNTEYPKLKATSKTHA